MFKQRPEIYTRALTLLLPLALLLTAGVAQAQGKYEHGDYTVYHTVFNSTFLKPDVAAAYGLTRGEQIFLVNVSVNKTGRSFGQAAQLKGTATDLIQKQRKLDFQEIDEGEAVYYIAPLRLAGQDILHFTIEVTPEPSAEPFTVNFTRKFAKQP